MQTLAEMNKREFLQQAFLTISRQSPAPFDAMQAATNVSVFSFDSFVGLFPDYNCEIHKTMKNINIYYFYCVERKKSNSNDKKFLVLRFA